MPTLAAAAAAVTSVMSDSVWPHRWQPTRLHCPWDSPGKKTGVGCHFLLQCMKVKSEREVAQSCPTLHDPMDCSLPGSSLHGIFQARVLEWVAIAFSVVSLCSCKPHSSFTPISQVNSSIFSFYAFISAVDTLVIIHSFLKLIFIVFSFCWTLNLWTVSP